MFFNVFDISFWGFPHFQRHPMAESCKEAWTESRILLPNLPMMMILSQCRTLGGKIRCKKTGFSPNSTNDEVPVVQNENLGTPLQRLWSIFLIGGIKMTKNGYGSKMSDIQEKCVGILNTITRTWHKYLLSLSCPKMSQQNMTDFEA